MEQGTKKKNKDVHVHVRMKKCCQESLQALDKTRGLSAQVSGERPSNTKSLFEELGNLTIPEAITKALSVDPPPTEQCNEQARGVYTKICTKHEKQHHAQQERHESILWLVLRGETPPLPAHVPTGTGTYYADRQRDFLRRHPDKTPPDYYLEYGQVYYDAFTKQLRPKLSADGQKWVDKTALLLQQKMEAKVGNTTAEKIQFDQLELSPGGVRNFAFSTHCDAYVEAGITSLSLSDQWAILKESKSGMVSLPGIEQFLCVSEREMIDLVVPDFYQSPSQQQ